MIDLSSVDVFDLLERADVENIRSASGGAEANFSCPFGNHAHGDQRPSAYMNVETTAWFCQGCHRRGNAISFWAELKSVSAAEAKRFLRETYGIEFNEPIGGSMANEISQRWAPRAAPAAPVRPPASYLSSLQVDWAHELAMEVVPAFATYMDERGFDFDVLHRWQIGFDYLTDRVAIPIFDVDGQLVGVKGRSYDGREPKYHVQGDLPGSVPQFGFTQYETKAVVFGLHRRRDCRTVVLNEGELNAVACEQVGVVRPIALGMSYMTEAHRDLIVREADEVVTFFDDDDSGRACTAQARQLLEPYVRVRHVGSHEHDAAKLVELGRGDEVLELVDSARSSLVESIHMRI
jgi:DNA primase